MCSSDILTIALGLSPKMPADASALQDIWVAIGMEPCGMDLIREIEHHMMNLFREIEPHVMNLVFCFLWTKVFWLFDEIEIDIQDKETVLFT